MTKSSQLTRAGCFSFIFFIFLLSASLDIQLQDQVHPQAKESRPHQEAGPRDDLQQLATFSFLQGLVARGQNQADNRHDDQSYRNQCHFPLSISHFCSSSSIRFSSCISYLYTDFYLFFYIQLIQYLYLILFSLWLFVAGLSLFPRFDYISF